MPTTDLSRALWRRSLRSQQNGACVEVATLDVPRDETGTTTQVA
jgi:hypothetical protein